MVTPSPRAPRSSLALLLGAAAIAGCPTADVPDVPEPSGPQSGTLSVLTYNVHGLPEAIAGDDPAGRMPQIVPLLEPFDLVGLQEAWTDEYYGMLTDADFPHQLRFPEKIEDDRQYGSGLAVFSAMPQVDHHHQHFTQCNGFFDGASDCLASKGFQRVTLELAPGVEVDLWNSHFEAGGGPDDVAARLSNTQEIRAAMEAESAGRAIIFTGDTNLHPWRDAEDVEPWETFVGAGLTDSCDAVDCAEPEHIDRVLFRSGDDVTLTATSWAREQAFVDEDGEDLSDHPAISATFAWSVE